MASRRESRIAYQPKGRMLGCTLDRPRPPPQPRSHVFAALDADAPAHQRRRMAAGHAPAGPRGADAGVRGGPRDGAPGAGAARSEEHASELQSLMRISYAVFCLKNKNNNNIE